LRVRIPPQRTIAQGRAIELRHHAIFCGRKVKTPVRKCRGRLSKVAGAVVSPLDRHTPELLRCRCLM
jgi:hypothetical protein